MLRSRELTFLIGVLLSACTSQKTLESLGTDYQSANQAAKNAVSAEVQKVKRTRRLAAVVAYLKSPNLSVAENINASDPLSSFINFVCTGADDFEITEAGLAYTSRYGDTVAAITKAPDDSVAGYISALRNLMIPGKPLSFPQVKQDQFQQCRKDVANDLPPTGFTAATARKEFAVAGVIASVTAMQTLISSIDALVKDGLRTATEAEQRKSLREFILNNKDNYSRVLYQDLSGNELNNAFEKRRKTSIAVPYYTFLHIFRFDIHREPSEILQVAGKVDDELSDYDAIRVQPSPAPLASVFKDINVKLLDYADGKVNLADTIQFLEETTVQLEQIKKDYDTTKTNLSNTQKALGG